MVSCNCPECRKRRRKDKRLERKSQCPRSVIVNAPRRCNEKEEHHE